MDKFNTMLESVYSQYQRGNFLVGDLVKFRGNYQSHDWVKGLIEGKLEKLRKMAEGGENLRICAVKPDRNPGINRDPAMDVGKFWVDIVVERAPGLYTDFLTIPEELLEKIELGINRAPIPDSQKKEDPSHIKPEIVEDAPQNTNLDMMKQTRCTHPDKVMPADNTTLPHASAPKEGESYTSKYLEH